MTGNDDQQGNRKVPNRAKSSSRQSAFLVTPFTNPCAGSVVYRVSGTLDGKRVRENFRTRQAAEARRTALEALRLGTQNPESVQATWLSREQLQVAESIFTRIPEVAEVRQAIDFWTTTGKAQAQATVHAIDLRLNDAVARFNEHLEGAVHLRDGSRRNLRYRVKMFASGLGNVPLARITPETIEAWLDERKAGPTTRDNDRRAVGRFFQWCIERPQRFLAANPAQVVRVHKPERAEPEIYSMKEVLWLLASARRFRKGRFLKFVVLQLFGGLRPSEALRFKDNQIVDGHLRLEGKQTKTGTPRACEVDPVLAAWLKICLPGPASDPQKSKILWAELKRKARLKRWVSDGLRHTAISHYFRRSESFGLTAEWAGNSESIIKKHYKARTAKLDAMRFWNLYPDRKTRLRARALGETGEGVKKSAPTPSRTKRRNRPS